MKVIGAICVHRVNLDACYQPKDIRYFKIRPSRFNELSAVRNVRIKRIVFYVDCVVGHTFYFECS